MKVTLKKLLESMDGFNAILKTPIDAKLAYRITKIVNKIVEESKHINKTRFELIKKYGEEVEVEKDGKKVKNGNWTLLPKNKEVFEKEYEEFLAMEVEFGAQLIPFECIEEIKISALDMAAISDFIEPPKGTEKEIANRMHKKKA